VACVIKTAQQGAPDLQTEARCSALATLSAGALHGMLSNNHPSGSGPR